MADAHIPAALEDFAIEMRGVPAVAGNYPTIFVGIVNKPHYTDEMWDNHRERIRELFQITDDNYCIDVRVYSEGENSSVIDNETLKRNFKTAIGQINNLRTRQLRIVQLGVGSSPSLDDGLIHLIRNWNVPRDEKFLQFVAMGESEHFYRLNFCRRRICMTNLVTSLQYYNTMDYSGFGTLLHETLPSRRMLDIAARLLRVLLWIGSIFAVIFLAVVAAVLVYFFVYTFDFSSSDIDRFKIVLQELLPVFWRLIR